MIAAGPGLLVFCEVKAKRGHGYGTPAEAVTLAKQARLRRLAAAYLDAVEHPPCPRHGRAGPAGREPRRGDHRSPLLSCVDRLTWPEPTGLASRVGAADEKCG